MGNANINKELKADIEKYLKQKEIDIEYQSLKGFIDKSCWHEIQHLKKKKII